MDENLYRQKQEEEFKRHEALCKHCGTCCGAHDSDPCANLAMGSDGRYYCRDYDNRVRAQVTRAGKHFHCIPIRDLYYGVAPYPGCAYGKTPGIPGNNPDARDT